jgi:hypothetical protein
MSVSAPEACCRDREHRSNFREESRSYRARPVITVTVAGEQ